MIGPRFHRTFISYFVLLHPNEGEVWFATIIFKRVFFKLKNMSMKIQKFKNEGVIKICSYKNLKNESQ
jgi:hypothetical protein